MNGTSWQFELTRPLWLAALLVLPLMVYYWRRTLLHFPPRQRTVAVVVRVVLVSLVIIALCGPRFAGQTRRQLIVALVDQSFSIPANSFDAVNPFQDAAEAGAYGSGEEKILRFARDCGDGPFWPSQGATNIAAAITAARAAIPATRVGQIVLFSDGNETTGDALAAAKAAGVPVSTVPLASLPDEVYVSDMHAPAEAREGEPFYVHVTIHSTHNDVGTVSIASRYMKGLDFRGAKDDSVPVVSERKRLFKGENRFRFLLSAPPGPAAVITARIGQCRDTLAENNDLAAMVHVGPKPRVLVVESQPVLAEKLAAALKGENIDVVVRPPQDLPARLEGLKQYELLILSNVPATSLPAERMEAIQHYVRDYGGGLIVVGGDQAFTAGGYRNTVLEETLPVISEANRERPKPSLAMVLVLDCSGSMKGRSIDLAKQATRRAVEKLGPRDQVGVLAFEDGTRWISPLHAATDKEKIIQQIDTIEAGGGTNMHTAFEQAYLALHESFADLKHMIVLTDGVSHPGDFDALTKHIAAAGISISTVGVGNEVARPLLEGIARRAKGHAYFVDDPAAIPKIFEMETTSAGKVGITEEPFAPQVVHAAQALQGLDFAPAEKGTVPICRNGPEGAAHKWGLSPFPRVPTLLGYVETQAKPQSRVILASKAGEPILASWHYGHGTAVAFTSDIQSRWAAAWHRWPGFARFWVQLVRQTMRREPPHDCVLRTEMIGDKLRVTLDARDAADQFINGAEARLKVAVVRSLRDWRPVSRSETPTESSDLPLPQVAPGRYQATITTVPSEPYLLETTLKHEGRVIDTQQRGIVTPYPDELRIQPTNTKLLRAIAEATGGHYNPQPADLFAPSDRTVPWSLALWPWLLVAALILFVADVALKRIEWKGKTAAESAEEPVDLEMVGENP